MFRLRRRDYVTLTVFNGCMQLITTYLLLFFSQPFYIIGVRLIGILVLGLLVNSYVKEWRVRHILGKSKRSFVTDYLLVSIVTLAVITVGIISCYRWLLLPVAVVFWLYFALVLGVIVDHLIICGLLRRL